MKHSFFEMLGKIKAEETIMLKTVEGIYQNGRVELAEISDDIKEAQVIVTFLPKTAARLLSDYGIDEAQAADLRARLHTFEEDWNHPEMDGYDAIHSAIL